MTEIGRHSGLPADAVCHHEVELTIGSFCSIASGFKIISGQHPKVNSPWCASNFPFREHGWEGSEHYPECHTRGRVWIGDDVWIGENVSIMSRDDRPVYVATGSTIAAGSVLVGCTSPFSLYAGNPARYKKTDRNAKLLLAIKWWEWDDEKIKRNMKYLGNVEEYENELRSAS